MKAADVIFLLKYASFVYAASDASRPRGVSPEFAKHYKDPRTFTCISNPSINLPFARVNDDYCDCPDGSDEPGTAACAHLSPLSPHTPADIPPNAVNTVQALPGFYCKNKGHIPAYVPFTNVNDGVCDYDLCCDGSEEWEGIGGTKCEDRCSQLGKEWKKQDEARQKSLGSATKKRKELVEQGKKLRKEVEDRIKTLTVEIEGGEIKLKQLEKELVDVEKREKGKVVKSGDGKPGGKLGVLIGMARPRMDELRESLIKVKEERDTSRDRVEELEQILRTFKEEYNPNFNDEGVKRAVRAWEDYAASDNGEEFNGARDRDLEEIAKTDKENGLDWEEYGGEEGSDTDVLYAFESYLPPTIRTWLDQRLRDLRVMMIENGILADSSPTEDSKPVKDARKRRDTSKKDLDNQKKDLTSKQEDLTKDFGPDDVFRALKGTCVTKDSGEYTYELCFMEKTTQKPKKGGGSTNMGNFKGFESIIVDDDLPADGKGVGSGERIAMKHEGGQHCWNGPNRSSMVVLACAEENEIWKIVEEEKCVYRVEVGSPAVCTAGNGVEGGGKEGKRKDEL